MQVLLVGFIAYLPSLKLTFFLWKWMVGIRSFPFGEANFQGRTVSFTEGIDFYLALVVCVDVLHHEIPSDIRLFGFHVKLFRSDLFGPCIPERDFWLHSPCFYSCVQICHHLWFIIHHSSIHQSFTIHQLINSSWRFLHLFYPILIVHRHVAPRSRGHETCAWLEETFRDCGGWGPYTLKGGMVPWWKVEPGGTWWMVIKNSWKKWLRFVNLFYFFPILHDILVGDLRCFHFLGFGMWMVDVQ